MPGGDDTHRVFFDMLEEMLQVIDADFEDRPPSLDQKHQLTNVIHDFQMCPLCPTIVPVVPVVPP